MTIESNNLSSAIGQRVREKRQAHRWTLGHLAEASGVSKRMVINVEQGDANPSVTTLLKLSEALGISLTALVEPPVTDLTKVTRKGEGAQLWTGDLGGSGVLVAATTPPNVVELWDWTLNANEIYDSGAHTAGTTELLQVRDGVVTMTVAGETTELKVDDAMRFSSDVPHTYANHRNKPARFSLTVFEPQVK